MSLFNSFFFILVVFYQHRLIESTPILDNESNDLYKLIDDNLDNGKHEFDNLISYRFNKILPNEVAAIGAKTVRDIISDIEQIPLHYQRNKIEKKVIKQAQKHLVVPKKSNQKHLHAKQVVNAPANQQDSNDQTTNNFNQIQNSNPLVDVNQDSNQEKNQNPGDNQMVSNEQESQQTLSNPPIPQGEPNAQPSDQQNSFDPNNVNDALQNDPTFTDPDPQQFIDQNILSNQENNDDQSDDKDKDSFNKEKDSDKDGKAEDDNNEHIDVNINVDVSDDLQEPQPIDIQTTTSTMVNPLLGPLYPVPPSYIDQNLEIPQESNQLPLLSDQNLLSFANQPSNLFSTLDQQFFIHPDLQQSSLQMQSSEPVQVQPSLVPSSASNPLEQTNIQPSSIQNPSAQPVLQTPTQTSYNEQLNNQPQNNLANTDQPAVLTQPLYDSVDPSQSISPTFKNKVPNKGPHSNPLNTNKENNQFTKHVVKNEKVVNHKTHQVTKSNLKKHISPKANGRSNSLVHENNKNLHNSYKYPINYIRANRGNIITKTVNRLTQSPHSNHHANTQTSSNVKVSGRLHRRDIDLMEDTGEEIEATEPNVVDDSKEHIEINLQNTGGSLVPLTDNLQVNVVDQPPPSEEEDKETVSVEDADSDYESKEEPLNVTITVYNDQTDKEQSNLEDFEQPETVITDDSMNESTNVEPSNVDSSLLEDKTSLLVPNNMIPANKNLEKSSNIVKTTLSKSKKASVITKKQHNLQVPNELRYDVPTKYNVVSSKNKNNSHQHLKKKHTLKNKKKSPENSFAAIKKHKTTVNNTKNKTSSQSSNHSKHTVKKDNKTKTDLKVHNKID